MLIFSQSSSLLIDFEKPMRYVVDTPNGRVFANFEDGHNELLGTYDTKDHAKFVLGRLAAAFLEGCSIYYMPSMVEVRGELMNRHCNPVRGTGAGSSHGGS